MKVILSVPAVIAALFLGACATTDDAGSEAVLNAACHRDGDVASSALNVRRASTTTISSSIIDEAVPSTQYAFSVKIEAGNDSMDGNFVGVEGAAVPFSIIENRAYIAKITPAVQGGGDVAEITSGTVSSGSTMFLSAVKGPFGPEMKYNILLSRLVRFDKDADGGDLPCMAYGYSRGVVTVGDEPITLPILVGDKTATVKIAVREIAGQTASR